MHGRCFIPMCHCLTFLTHKHVGLSAFERPKAGSYLGQWYCTGELLSVLESLHTSAVRIADIADAFHMCQFLVYANASTRVFQYARDP